MSADAWYWLVAAVAITLSLTCIFGPVMMSAVMTGGWL